MDGGYGVKLGLAFGLGRCLGRTQGSSGVWAVLELVWMGMDGMNGKRDRMVLVWHYGTYSVIVFTQFESTLSSRPVSLSPGQERFDYFGLQ